MVQPADQASTPRLIALVLCEEIHVDQETNSVSLIRLTDVGFSNPPSTWEGFIYVKASGVSLQDPVTITVTRASDGALFGGIPSAFRELALPTVGVLYEQLSIPLSEAVTLWFAVEINGREIGRTPFSVG